MCGYMCVRERKRESICVWEREGLIAYTYTYVKVHTHTFLFIMCQYILIAEALSKYSICAYQS